MATILPIIKAVMSTRSYNIKPSLPNEKVSKNVGPQSNVEINPNVSYAQIIGQQAQTSSNQNQPTNNDMSELKSMLMMLLQQMNNMFNVLNTVLTKMS